MRVNIGGTSPSARAVRSYLDKHGAAVTDGQANVYVLIEPSKTTHIELDTIACSLTFSVLKHMNRIVNCPVTLYLASTGQVTADNQIIVRIPPEVEQAAEIAVFRGVAEHLGRAALEPQTKRRSPFEWLRENWKSIALAGLLLLAIILMTLKSRAAETPNQPMPISAQDRESIKDLQIKAQDAVIRQKDAEARRAEAQLDLEHAERDRDAFNAQISAKTEDLVKQYAPDGGWKIRADFTWVKKGP